MLGFNAEDVYEQETGMMCCLEAISNLLYLLDVNDIIRQMPSKSLPPELIIRLIEAMGIVPRVGEEIDPELRVLCRMWLHHSRSPSLDKLVKVLLCTPGAGHLVTGLVPICECVISSASS